jgi:hypothetical protein
MELDDLKRRIEFANETVGQRLLTELRELWESDFEPKSAVICTADDRTVSWSDVLAALRPAVSRIQIRMVNGEAKDALEYVEHPDGLSVIVIGGDKLSRGLTLEGLSVSYYLRATNMYDTLMQMGRWFGYRPGYLDLCRLYTTEELELWYRHITLADEELRREFDEMEGTGATPRQYAMRVRTSPDGLLITAINKMRDTVEMELSYARRIAELSAIHREPDAVMHNFGVTAAFLDSLGAYEQSTLTRNNLVWSGVPGAAVAAYLDRLRSHQHAGTADASRLAEYISTQLTRPDRKELTEWTVVLVDNTRPQPGRSSSVEIGRYTIRTTWRDPVDNVRKVYAIKQGRIINPPDEFLDLTVEECNAALQETIAGYRRNPGRRTKEPDKPNGEAIRIVRPPERGLLILYPLFPPPELGYRSDVKAIIGYAVSFPDSKTARSVKYRVGELLWRRVLGEEDDDES